MWILYIIQCNDNSLYIGITNNLKKRIEAHSNGRGAKYTRGKGPFQILYTESYMSRSSASKREYVLKQLTLNEKLSLIRNYNYK